VLAGGACSTNAQCCGGSCSGGVCGGSGCAPQCNIDADCMNTCSPQPGATYCCDTATSKCYVSSHSTCP
jgi:hypothetical protein